MHSPGIWLPELCSRLLLFCAAVDAALYGVSLSSLPEIPRCARALLDFVVFFRRYGRTVCGGLICDRHGRLDDDVDRFSAIVVVGAVVALD